MKTFALISFIAISTSSFAQVFKNVGIKTGVTRSFFVWNYKENSTSTHKVTEKGSKAIGVASYLHGDLVENDYWALNLAAGWVQRNASLLYTDGKIAESYYTSYLSFNPSVRGKWPLTKRFNLFLQTGFRTDYMLTYSDNVDYYEMDLVPYIGQKDELKKVNVGMTIGPGAEFSFRKTKLRLEYAGWLDFNNVINAKGPRLDGLGDEGFFLKLKSYTSLYSLSVVFDLTGDNNKNKTD